MPSSFVERIFNGDQKYKKCVGCCQLRTGVFVVGALELLALGVAVVTLFVLYELTAEPFTKSSIGHTVAQPKSMRTGMNFGNATFGNVSKMIIQDDSLESSESSEESDHKDGSSSESSEEDDRNSNLIKDLVYLRAKHRYYVRSMAGAAVAFVCGIFVVTLMFVGVVKRRSRLILPHLIVQVLAMIGLIIVIILYSVWCTQRHESDEAKRHLYPINQSISCWLIIGSCTLALILEIISLWTVLTFYKYLRDLADIEYEAENRHWANLDTKRNDMAKLRLLNTQNGVHIGNKV